MDKSEKTTKELVKESVKEIIEIFDDKVIGDFMDNPLIDKLEEKLVEVVIDSLWLTNTTIIDETFMSWSA
jgi:hypothetical protein